jgi:tripartite ATP-independent transporter DctP family solute receptor
MRQKLFFNLIISSIFSITSLYVSSVSAQTNLDLDKEWSLKFGHDQSPEHAYHQAAVFFGEKLKEKTNGKVKVAVFPSAQLGAEGTMLDSLRIGSLDFCISSSANASSHVPQMAFLGIAYLFDNKEHLAHVTSDPQILKSFQNFVADKKLGFQLLAFMPNGLRNLYAIKEVKSLKDLQGMKVRVMPSPIESKVWAALGAKPTSVPYGEVYTALQTGMVAGAENTVSSYAQGKHNEVAKYFIKTSHQWQIVNIWASDKTLQSLPEPYRKAVIDSASEAALYGFQKQLENDEAYTKVLTTSGVTFINVNVKEFADKIKPLHDQFAKDLKTEDILRRILEIK